MTNRNARQPRTVWDESDAARSAELLRVAPDAAFARAQGSPYNALDDEQITELLTQVLKQVWHG